MPTVCRPRRGTRCVVGRPRSTAVPVRCGRLGCCGASAPGGRAKPSHLRLPRSS